MAEVPFVVLRLEHFSMARRIGFPDRLYAGCIRELTYHTDPIAPPKKDHKRKAPPTAPPTGQLTHSRPEQSKGVEYATPK